MRLFWRRSKKTLKLRVTGLCEGSIPDYRWPMNSPHKRPVSRKMFPFDNVIMQLCFYPITHAFPLGTGNYFAKLPAKKTLFVTTSLSTTCSSGTKSMMKCLYWKYHLNCHLGIFFDKNLVVSLKTLHSSTISYAINEFSMQVFIIRKCYSQADGRL